MSIKILINQLRKAADALEALLVVSEVANETPAVAKAIRQDLPKNHKVHWTQTKKGKRLLAKRSKEMWAKKRAKQAEQEEKAKWAQKRTLRKAS